MSKTEKVLVLLATLLLLVVCCLGMPYALPAITRAIIAPVQSFLVHIAVTLWMWGHGVAP